MKWSKVVNIFAVVVIVIAIPITVYLALHQQEIRQRASENITVLMTPSTQNATVGQPFSISFDVKSEQTPLTGARLIVIYPAQKLSIDQIDVTSSVFETQIEQFFGNGLITIDRETNAPIVGTKHIATIRFNVLQEVNASEISLSPGSPTFKSADNKNIVAYAKLADSLPQQSTRTSSSFWDLSSFFSTLFSLFKSLHIF